MVKEYRRLLTDILIPDLEGNLVREFIVSNYQKFYEDIPFTVLDIAPVGEGKALVTYRISNEAVLCARPRNERNISSSSSPGKRLPGWG